MIVCDRCKTELPDPERVKFGFHWLNEADQAEGMVDALPSSVEVCDVCLNDLDVVLKAWLANGGPR